jgi:hypothetical protein
MFVDDDFRRMISAADRISRAKFFIDDQAAPSILEMRARARRFREDKHIFTGHKEQFGLIIVDYLQLARGGAAATTRASRRSARSPAGSRRWPRSCTCRYWRCRSSIGRSTAGPTTGRSSRTCASPGRSSRMQTSSCSSTGRSGTCPGTRQARGAGEGREQGRDHHRQAAQRADRHGAPDLPEAPHALREHAQRARHHGLIAPRISGRRRKGGGRARGAWKSRRCP